jgi:hypothetical protein
MPICIDTRLRDCVKADASVVHWSDFLSKNPELPGRFPALPHFLRKNGSGTECTQTHADN